MVIMWKIKDEFRRLQYTQPLDIRGMPANVENTIVVAATGANVCGYKSQAETAAIGVGSFGATAAPLEKSPRHRHIVSSNTGGRVYSCTMHL